MAEKKREEEKPVDFIEEKQAYALLWQLGIGMAACVFVGVVIGKYLDRWLGTGPWLLILFALLGGAAAFKVLYDSVTK